ncbi:MAG: hypothetical protein Q9176_003635 [Flavoplaca citrina]
MAPPPQFFYRVQHRGSYTTYNPYNGFVSRGHYDVHPAELLNKRTVEAHLDWGDRSNQPSPFISVFDNYDMPTTELATMYSGEIADEPSTPKADTHNMPSPNMPRPNTGTPSALSASMTRPIGKSLLLKTASVEGILAIAVTGARKIFENATAYTAYIASKHKETCIGDATRNTLEHIYNMRFPIKHSTETSSSTRRPSAPTVKSPSVLGGAQTTTVVPRETHQHLRSYRYLPKPTSIVLPNWPLESSKVSSLHQIAEDQNSRVPAIVREHFTNGKCSQLESDLKKATEEIQRLKKGFEDELAEKELTLEGERKDLARQLAKLAQDNENLQAEKLRLSTDEKALHQQQNAANQRVKEAERRIKDADRRG